MAAVMLTGCSD